MTHKGYRPTFSTFFSAETAACAQAQENGEGMASRIGVKAQDVRSSALWGRGGRTKAALIAFVVVALRVPAASVAGAASGTGGSALVPAALLAQATANPLQTFHVIVQGTKGNSSKTVASD